MAGVISSLFISRNQYENTKRNVNFNVCKNNVIFYEHFSVKIECFKCCRKMNKYTLVTGMNPLLFFPVSFFFFLRLLLMDQEQLRKVKRIQISGYGSWYVTIHTC